jgi:hypothetical protein
MIFCSALFLALAFPGAALAQRLNFYLTNLTGLGINEVFIAPTYYPDYRTENLLQQASLEANSRIYIGPNYYGSQAYWNITIGWENGHKVTFTSCRLTRYNSYTVYVNSYGVGMRQGYERNLASYPSPAFTYGGGNPQVRVDVGPQRRVAVSKKKRVRKAGPNTVLANGNMAWSDAGDTGRPKRRTRDLVFEDDAKAQPEVPPAVEGDTSEGVTGEVLAMKATVERTRDNQTLTVLPSDEFRSGDRAKLIFSVNRDGYIYWLAKGSSGQYQLLFPTNKTGPDNTVVKNKEYTVPTTGSWRFDDQKGSETVVAVFSPKRLDKAEEAVKLANEGKKEEASKIVASLIDGHENKRTTRDLVFEEEDQGDVNTKTQETADGEPFVATYDLVHN